MSIELVQPATQLLLPPTLCSEHDPVTRSMKPIRLRSIPGSNSSQSASGSGNSRSRTPRELSWSEAREEGEASEQRVSGGADLGLLWPWGATARTSRLEGGEGEARGYSLGG